MDPLALVLRTAVAAVLAAAGVAKLKDLTGSREAMRGFGVPDGLAPAAGLALPLVEIGAAVGLIVPSLSRWGAVAATSLFLLMSTAIVRLLAIGQAPSCHCFGQLQSEPVGKGTLVRSWVLALGAGFVAVQGAGDRLGELGPFGAETLVPVAAGAAAWVLAQRAASKPRLFQNAPARGSVAPGFSLPRPEGGEGSLDALVAKGRPTALLFVEPGCGPCKALLAEIGSWQTGITQDVNVAVLVKGGRDATRQVGDLHGLGDDLMYDEEGSTSNDYGVRATPTAVLVGADGRVARNPAAGKDGIEALLRLALQDGSSEGAERRLSAIDPVHQRG